LCKRKSAEYSESNEECNEEGVKKLTFNDRIFYQWESKWVEMEKDLLRENLEKLARYSVLTKIVNSLVSDEEDRDKILGNLNEWARILGGADVYLERSVKIEIEEALAKQARTPKDRAKLLIEIDKKIEELMKKEWKRMEDLIRKQIEQIEKIDEVLGPGKFILTNNGETVIYKAPFSNGKIKIICRVRDSGVQASDGEKLSKD